MIYFDTRKTPLANNINEQPRQGYWDSNLTTVHHSNHCGCCPRKQTTNYPSDRHRLVIMCLSRLAPYNETPAMYPHSTDQTEWGRRLETAAR